jgi:hypothetical protein
LQFIWSLEFGYWDFQSIHQTHFKKEISPIAILILVPQTFEPKLCPFLDAWWNGYPEGSLSQSLGYGDEFPGAMNGFLGCNPDHSVKIEFIR